MYPIRLIDYLWELEIILWVITLMILYLLGAYFVKKYFKEPIESKPFNFGISLFLFGYGTARLIEFIRSYYIAYEYSLFGYYDIVITNFQITGIDLLMRLSYIIISYFVITVVCFSIEKYILRELGYNTRYFITITSIITGIISVLLYFNMLWLLPVLTVTFFIIVGSIVSFFLFFGFRSEGRLKRSFILCAIGFSLFVFGLIMTLPDTHIMMTEFITSIETFVHLGSPLFHIAGGIIVTFGFQLELFNWSQKIQYLYVLMPNGVCVFDYNFRHKIMDENLISGTLVAITEIIQEVTKSKTKLKTIQQEEAIFLLEYGKNVMVALLTTENLSVLRNKLEIFLEEFETFFIDIFPVWKGDTTVFLPANVLVERIFKT